MPLDIPRPFRSLIQLHPPAPSAHPSQPVHLSPHRIATYKRRHDARTIPHRQLHPRRRRPLPIPRLITRQPRQRQSHHHIQAQRHHKAPEIMHPRPRVRQQDPIPHHADGPEAHAVHPAQLLRVRHPRHGQIRHGAEYVAGDRQGLHLRRRPVPDRRDDGRQEGAVAVEHGVGAELGGAEGPDFPVAQAEPHVCCVHFLRRRRLALLARQADGHEGFFAGGQVVGCLRVVG